MKAYASFAEWKADQSPRNQRLIAALAKIVEGVAPEFTRSVKWGQGCWLSGETPKVYIHAEPDHVQLGFYAGATLDDPDGLLVGKGKYVRHVKVFTRGDIDAEGFEKLVRQVV
jgi:hypothetical protein